MAKTLEELQTEQNARSEKYGIKVKENYGSIEKPEVYKDLTDDDFADPVHYKYPLHDKANTLASSRTFDIWGREYPDQEKQIILAKIFTARDKFKLATDDFRYSEQEETETDLDYIEVFKAGKHTDSGGDTREWTEKDLDTIVTKYNEQKEEDRHEAPIVAGSHKSDGPAYGWADKLKKSGTKLLAKFKQVDDEFKKLVNDGRYNKISIALYPDLKLRHVAFLGATPPAIKGLKAPAFKEDDKYITFEYEEESKAEDPKTDFLTYAEGTSMDEATMTAFVEWAKKEFDADIAGKIAAKVQSLKPATPAKPDNKPATAPKFEESPEFIELKRRTEEQDKVIEEMQFNEYFDKQAQAGKLIPAQKPIIKLAIEAVKRPNEKGFAFGEATINGEEVIKKLVDSFPKMVEFNEFANRNEFQEQYEKRKEGLKEIAEQRNKARGV